MFSDWYAEAAAGATLNPDTVALASANREARPSCRMVFYRGIRAGGFSFFTNYESRKGLELSDNPFAAMVFYWPQVGKQVRIEGSVQRLSSEESDAYFLRRPVESQITAAASRQSRPLLDESEFVARIAQLEHASKKQSVVRPSNWGGFTLMPDRFEFWKRGDHRRHWRLLFEKEGSRWNDVRLYP
jgi:pyridoxamine 5'-phosphate oxidase